MHAEMIPQGMTVSMKNPRNLVQGKWEWAILVVAVLLRFVLLDIKPPHFDEGINGWFCEQMTAKGFYAYDPENYHGPLHFYVLWNFLAIGGRSLWAMRLPVVLVGIVAVWLALRFDRFFGKASCRWAALLLAVSPAVVFYNRYSIHETWQQVFLMLFAWGAMGLWRFGTRGYLWALGMALTGLILTKETYVIHVFCFLLAGLGAWIWHAALPASHIRRSAWRVTMEDLWAVGAVGMVTVVFFYSGTFLNWSLLEGLSTTFDHWVQTGSAEQGGHQKPGSYWLDLIARYEGPMALGLVCAVFAFLPRFPGLLRWLAIYACGALAAYSIVPYKTPWCIISILWPFAFCFGYFLTKLPPFVGPALGGLMIFQTLTETISLNFFRFTDERHPYVYVQTFPGIEKMTHPLLTLALQNPENYHLRGLVLTSSYFPLPWVLGDFDNIGWWGKRRPKSYEADFLLVNTKDEKVVERHLTDDYFKEPLKIRDSQEASIAYFRASYFDVMFPGREPDFVAPEEVP